MWNVSIDQAVEMYARFCQARYGTKAIEIAEAKAIELRKAGDAEGERVWKNVRVRAGTQALEESPLL